MYIPPHFQEERVEVLHELIRSEPLAAVVTSGADGLIASHIPMVLDAETGPLGTLRAHMARQNSQWKSFDTDRDALVIFTGPQHYITPAWYPAKAEHGKVVPTWNYAAIHAYGRIELIEDGERLLRHLHELTDTHESPRVEPWSVNDAPAGYVEALMQSIIGLEIRITRLEGKWKVSQNRSLADRQGVAEGLRAMDAPEAHEVANLVESTFDPLG